MPEPSVSFEKRSIFYINFILVLIAMYSFLFEISMKYFFYITMFSTLALSYYFFRRSRKLSKMLIISNMFIMFYFLSFSMDWFLRDLLGYSSYLYLLFYQIFLGFAFLSFSGYHRTFMGDMGKFSVRVFMAVLLLGFAFGLLFIFINEPLPARMLPAVFESTFYGIFFMAFAAFFVALSEQLIFSGLYYNIYKHETSSFEALFQVCVLFVSFHFLKFNFLHFSDIFGTLAPLAIGGYYLLLFFFMLAAIYLYDMRKKRYHGNFLYPLVLHFAADLILFLWYFNQL